MKCNGKFSDSRRTHDCDSWYGCGKQHCPVTANNGVRDILQDVKAFHLAVDQPVLETPTIPSDERVELRGKLIQEEYQEVLLSMFENLYTEEWNVRDDIDLVALADGLADLIYVVVGTALEFGIPLDKVWAEVQRSNLSKLGPDGKAVKRLDGKILKGPGFSPPDLSFLNEKP